MNKAIPTTKTKETTKINKTVGSWIKDADNQLNIFSHNMELSRDWYQLWLVATHDVSENIVFEVHKTTRELLTQKAASQPG